MRRMAAGWIAGLALISTPMISAPCLAQDQDFISARQVVDDLHSPDAPAQKIGKATIVLTWQAFMTAEAALIARKADMLFCPAPDAQVSDQQLADGVETMIGADTRLSDMPVSTAMLLYLEKQYPCTDDAKKKLQAGG